MVKKDKGDNDAAIKAVMGRWTRGRGRASTSNNNRGKRRGRGRGRGRSRGRGSSGGRWTRGRGAGSRGRGAGSRGRGRRGRGRGRGRNNRSFRTSISTRSGAERARGKIRLVPNGGFTLKSGLQVTKGDDQDRTIRITGLHANVQVGDLKEIFGTYGVIIHAFVSNKPDGTPSGNGKVCFAQSSSAILAANELDGATIDQVAINVSYLGNQNSAFYQKVVSGQFSPRSSESTPVRAAGLAAGGEDEMEVEDKEDDKPFERYQMPKKFGKLPPTTPSNPLAR